MKKIQLTLVQIDNYGPWTVTPRPKREADIQILQAKLFADLEHQFAVRGGLVFSTRFDNMLAISNSISLDEHRAIQESIHVRYPVTVSMSIGAAETPYEAQKLAAQALQRAGSSRSAERRGILAGRGLGARDEDWVQIVHMDVDHISAMTDEKPIYDTHELLQHVCLALMKAMSRYKALVFYTGGDNFMAPSNGLCEEKLRLIIDEVERALGIKLKAGVGCGKTAGEAAHLASEGLHEIRKCQAKGPIVSKTPA